MLISLKLHVARGYNMTTFYALMTGVCFGLVPVYPVHASMIMMLVFAGSMVLKGEGKI